MRATPIRSSLVLGVAALSVCSRGSAAVAEGDLSPRFDTLSIGDHCVDDTANVFRVYAELTL